MIAPLDRLLALLAQKRGDCSRGQLRRLARIWKISGSPADLLAYAAFRRNLGHPLPARWLQPLATALPCLSRAGRESALALLLEWFPDFRDEKLSEALATTPARMPPLAFAREQAAGISAHSPAARIHARQPAWREEFRQSLVRAAAAGGICVVGNSGSLIASGLGAAIDRHEIVIRFNRFESRGEVAADFGSKLSVWVCAPNFTEPSPPGPSRVVVSGPDVRFRLRRWDRFLDFVGNSTPVLTVPLDTWGELVRVLQAPPSAGLLMLAWIRGILGSWNGVGVAGMGRLGGPLTPYHAVHRSQPPGNRHRWAAESDLLQKWQPEGLRILLPAGRSGGGCPGPRAGRDWSPQ